MYANTHLPGYHDDCGHSTDPCKLTPISTSFLITGLSEWFRVWMHSFLSIYDNAIHPI